MKFRTFLIAATLFTLFALPVFALDLAQARASGAVGEKLDGYITALQSTPEVQALVANVNAKRRDEYARISKENGQPLDVVAKLAAQQVINNLPRGSSYQAPDGSWRKR